MSGPDITVEADGRAESTTVLVAKARLPRVQRRTSRSAPLPARARRTGTARCRPGRGPGGAGDTQVPDALRPPARAGALGGPRRVRRHVGAAGVAAQPSNQLPAARCLALRHRLPPPPRRRRRFRRQVSPSTLPRRGTSGRRSWAGSCSTGGRTMAGSAAPSPGPSLPARRVLTRGGVHAPDVSTARHGGLAARLRLLRCPMGAALSGARFRLRGRVSGPPTPTLSFSLVGGSSQFRPARSGSTAMVP